MLIFRPEYELVTKYINAWYDIIEGAAVANGLELIDLNMNSARRETLESRIKDVTDNFVFFGTHGVYCCIYGQEDHIAIRACENDDILNGKIVYALACRTARILGPSAISKGAETFIGYDEDFVFFMNEPQPEDPTADDFARGFMEGSMQVPLSLIYGMSPEQAWENAQQVYSEWINYWSGQPTPEAPFIVSALMFDKAHLTMLSTGKEVRAGISLPVLAFVPVLAGLGLFFYVK